MGRTKKASRPRTIMRRARAAGEKLTKARNRLVDLAAGGAPERPIEVSTPALVEPKAAAVACPRCESPFAVAAHEAITGPWGRLREAKLRCRECGFERSLWFRIAEPS